MDVLPAGRHDVRGRVMGITQGRLVADRITQEIAGAHCGQLGKPFHEPLSLSPFAYAWRADENDTSGPFELLGGHLS